MEKELVKMKPTKGKRLSRYKPASVLQPTEAGEPKRERTQVLSAHVPRSVAIKLIGLFDDWAKAVKYKPAGGNAANKTRDQIKSQATGVKLGFSVTPATIQNIEDRAAAEDRKKNFLAVRAISTGAEKLTREDLLTEYEGVRPSLSLVTLLAFSRGWQVSAATNEN